METIVFWIAIWGAVISTILAIIRVIELKSSRATISVKTNYARPVYRDNVGSRLMLGLTARNTGRDKAILEAAGLSLSDGSYIPWHHELAIIGDTLPYELTGNDSCSVYFDIAEIKETLKNDPDVKITKAWFRDKLGNTHPCNPPKDLMKVIKS